MKIYRSKNSHDIAAQYFHPHGFDGCVVIGAEKSATTSQERVVKVTPGGTGGKDWVYFSYSEKEKYYRPMY